MPTTDKPLSKWNVRDFQSYLKAEHERLYGVPYVPMPTREPWKAEAGMLGRWVGTKRKPGEYGPEITKRFIDLCFAEYRPTAEWPGISFGFMQTYMGRNLQRAVAEIRAEAAAQQRREQQAEIGDDFY
ncbi:hypothetical protein EI976_20625 [Bacillus licheniformis]|uniref:hypothetical protein n=1 Tax=Bacillus TaxID=1386 RepID=UPI0002EE5D51|nr:MULTISPECIES: hypothetical protein [Bacillus]KAA0807290.1 hypothetical protein EI978_21105 [Bacillus licheniformis]KAA0819745.1 hypothetical protein EI976_20625 [Bacillus licheniformis]KAA0820751.1 hypothetical protein EI973_21310 [Bacillus licheniformis]MBC9090137.1 hypothetical protein [Bacillus sp. Y1]NBB46317.1 hypothetical protein [Bacillus sp. y1(2019)]